MSWFVTPIVFVVNVFGWIFLLGMHLMNCEPFLRYFNVMICFVLVQCTEALFLIFQFVICCKPMWSSKDWIVWKLVLFFGCVSSIFETVILWQEYNAATHHDNNSQSAFIPQLMVCTLDFVSVFLSLSYILQMCFIVYLCFLGAQEHRRASLTRLLHLSANLL